MNDLLYMIFGPLHKDSCIYFLLLSIFFFSLLFFTFMIEIVYLFRNIKSLSIRHFFNAFLISFNLLLGYFVNRLLYTMCSKSLI